MEPNEMIRLSELLGRIDGKLDGALGDIRQQRMELGALTARVTKLESQVARFVGWVIGSAATGALASQGIEQVVMLLAA